MLNQLTNIIVAPSVAFTSVKEKPTVLYPLLIVLVATMLMQVSVIYLSDFDYLIGQMIEQTAERSGAPVSEISQRMENITPAFLIIQVVLGIGLVLPIVYAIYAGYLNLIAKLSDDNLTFKHFYSLMCWSGLPVIVALLATLANLFISDGQFSSLEAANPLTLNSLLFGSQAGHPLFDSIGVINIWSLILLIIGFRVITDSGWVKSVIVPALPQVLIYGLVFVFTSQA